MLNFALSGSNPKFYEKYDLRETCKFIKSVGMSAIELVEANVPLLQNKAAEVGVWSQRDITDAKRILREENCTAPVLQFRFGFNKDRAHEIDTHVREFKACIDAAAALGSEYVLHYLSPSVFADQNMSLIHRYLDEPLEYAEKQGITLVLENEFDTAPMETPEKALSVMQEFNSRFFQLNYDAPNFDMAGCEGFPYAYNLLKKYIGYVHLKNACVHKPEYYDSRYETGYTITGGVYEGNPIAFVPTFEGAVNVFGILRRLEEDRYGGWITLEPHAALELAMEDLKRDIAILKALGYIA